MVEPAVNIVVWVTYIPLRGIPRNGFGRAASEKDPKGTSPTSYLGGVPPRSDRNAVDSRASARRDARL